MADRVALMKHRIEQARECLKSAEILICEEAYRDAMNRAYYSMFHSARAVLAIDNFDSKKHSGIISAFRERYVKTGKISSHLSRMIGTAFEMRNDSDYQDFYIVSKDDVTEQAENAKQFLLAVEEYIKTISENELCQD